MQKRYLLWPLLFVILAFLSYMIVSNRYELPMHDKARDVVGFRTENGSDIAYDKDGKVVKNWQQNNPVDDILKGLIVLGAILAFWQTLNLFIRNNWIKLVILIAAIPITYGVVIAIELALW